MKIYIISESHSSSGGPESLQQLAYYLRKNGYDSYLYYVDDINGITPNKFNEYNNRVAKTIEDQTENIMIVPESYSEVLKKYKSIHKVIWWLSLDFYLNNRWLNRTILFCNVHNIPKIFSPVCFLYLLVAKKLKWNLYKCKKNDNVFHLYNCEYVNDYLTKKGINESNKMYLCGPIREEYFKNEINIANRENNILYNPKKGSEFTKKLIKRSDLNFIPIINMTPEQIVELMKKSKIYIDFGYFPGPERIPREAVMCGCNIITSNKGSASNKYDVLIPNNYKFTIDDDNIDSILKCIKKMLDNYEKYYHDFDEYREKVINQKLDFEKNVIIFMEKIKCL